VAILNLRDSSATSEPLDCGRSRVRLRPPVSVLVAASPPSSGGLRSGTPLSGLSFPRLRHPNNRGLSGTPFRRRGPLPLTRPRTAMPPASPGLQPIKWRGLLLLDSSPRPIAGSGRSQNDSCGQFACAVCHEMKNYWDFFISWHDFSQFCPKHGHEMNNCCGYFILCSKSWDNEGGTVRVFSAPLPLCPSLQLRTFAHSSSRKKAFDMTRPWGGCRRGLCQMTGLQRGAFDMTLALTRLYPLQV